MHNTVTLLGHQDLGYQIPQTLKRQQRRIDNIQPHSRIIYLQAERPAFDSQVPRRVIHRPHASKDEVRQVPMEANLHGGLHV